MKEILASATSFELFITFLYFLTSSITTFDIRLTQAKKQGVIPTNEDFVPKWVALVYWADWALILILAIANWRYAIMVFIIRFILKVLPVLEVVGNLLMAPFKKK